LTIIYGIRKLNDQNFKPDFISLPRNRNRNKEGLSLIVLNQNFLFIHTKVVMLAMLTQWAKSPKKNSLKELLSKMYSYRLLFRRFCPIG